VEVPEAAKRAPVIDMMEALKKSLASRSKTEAEPKKLPAKHRKVTVKAKKAS
jgi:non-homologous end joining protein Ku